MSLAMNLVSELQLLKINKHVASCEDSKIFFFFLWFYLG